VDVIKQGSLVKLKPKMCHEGMPAWCQRTMIWDVCVANSPTAMTNHVGRMVCYNMARTDYFFIHESRLEVVQAPMKQMSMFDHTIWGIS